MARREPGRAPILTCSEVRDRLYPLLLRALGERERLETLDHAQACEACQTALLTARRRFAGIRGLPAADPEAQKRERPPASRSGLALALVPALLVAAAYAFLLHHAIETARNRDERAFAARLQAALLLYRQDHGSFPPQSGLPLTFYLAGAEPGLEPYLEVGKERLDASGAFADSWGNRYLYRSPGLRNPRLFDFSSLGPNGRDDGGRGDDVANW